MRDIKYRGMCLYNYGTWFYGLLANPKVDLKNVKAGWYISNSAGMPFAYAVRPETIGQCICLKDKNDKEIYEGDVVFAQHGESYMGAREYTKRIYVKDLIEDTFALSHYEDLLLLGNIYENPELIKESKDV